MFLIGNSLGELKTLSLNVKNEKKNFKFKSIISLNGYSIDQINSDKQGEIFFGSKLGILASFDKDRDKLITNKDVGDKKLYVYQTLHNGTVIAFYDNYMRIWGRVDNSYLFSMNKLICGKKFKYIFVDKTERFFLSASFFENRIYIWNLIGKKIVLGGKTELKEFIVCFKGTLGNMFSIGTHTGSIYIYSIYGEIIKIFKNKNSVIDFSKPDLQKAAVWGNRNILFSGKSSGKIELFDIRCNKSISRITGHSCEISNLAISGNSTRSNPFLLGSSDIKGNLKLWDVRNEKELFFQKSVDSKITSFCFS